MAINDYTVTGQELEAQYGRPFGVPGVSDATPLQDITISKKNKDLRYLLKKKNKPVRDAYIANLVAVQRSNAAAAENARRIQALQAGYGNVAQDRSALFQNYLNAQYGNIDSAAQQSAAQQRARMRQLGMNTTVTVGNTALQEAARQKNLLAAQAALQQDAIQREGRYKQLGVLEGVDNQPLSINTLMQYGQMPGQVHSALKEKRAAIRAAEATRSGAKKSGLVRAGLGALQGGIQGFMMGGPTGAALGAVAGGAGGYLNKGGGGGGIGGFGGGGGYTPFNPFNKPSQAPPEFASAPVRYGENPYFTPDQYVDPSDWSKGYERPRG